MVCFRPAPLLLLATQFGAVPEALLEQIENASNLERLEAALLQVPRLKSLEEFHL